MNNEFIRRVTSSNPEALALSSGHFQTVSVMTEELPPEERSWDLRSRSTFRIDVTAILGAQCLKHPGSQVLSEKVLLVKPKNGLIK